MFLTKWWRTFFVLSLLCMAEPVEAMELSKAQVVGKTEIITPEVVIGATQGDPHSLYLLGQFHEHGLEVKSVDLERNRKEAINCYKAAALAGHCLAQYRMGILHKKNSRAFAMRFFEMAAAQGHILSQYELAEFYNENHLEESQSKAVIYYKQVMNNEKFLQDPSTDKEYAKAVEKVRSRAAYRLGCAYEKGIAQLVPQSHSSAAEYYRISIKIDAYEHALFALAKLLHKNLVTPLSGETILELLTQARKKFFSPATCLLADILWSQKDQPKGEDQALTLYKEAAQSNNYEAMMKLAAIYKKKGTTDAAMNLYQQAATLGSDEAIELLSDLAIKDNNSELMVFLASLLCTDKRVKKNEKAAIEWCKKGLYQRNDALFKLLTDLAEHNVSAQYVLGQVYEEGRAITLDSEKALDWYAKAASLNHLEALHRIQELAEKNQQKAVLIVAQFQHDGLAGVEKDINKAVALYIKAAECGSAEAAFILGQLFLEGKDIAQDEMTSAHYFVQALRLNHPEAFKTLAAHAVLWPTFAYVLGQLYEQGSIIERNCDEAAKWYKIGTGKKHILSIRALGQLYEKIPPLFLESAQSVFRCYGEALRWYQDGSALQDQVSTDYGQRVMAICDSLRKLGEPDFLNSLFLKIRPALDQRVSPQFVYLVAYLTELTVRRFQESTQKILGQALIDLSKIGEKSDLPVLILSFIKDIIESPEFHKEQLTQTGETFRKSEIGRICSGIQLMQSIKGNFKHIGPNQKVKRVDDNVRDLRIEVYNCLFKNNTAPKEAAYTGAIQQILKLFDNYAHSMSMDMLTDNEPGWEGVVGTKEKLQEFLIYHTTDRFKNRIIRIAQKLQLLDPVTAAYVLSTWAVAGWHCATRCEMETQKFDVLNTTTSTQLDADDAPFETRSAICLAELRLSLLESLVPANEKERLHKIGILFKKVGKSLALVGDAENYVDNLLQLDATLKEEVQSYQQMLPEEIIAQVMKKYTVEKMVEAIKKEINKIDKTRLPLAKLRNYLDAIMPNKTADILPLLYDEDMAKMTDDGVKMLLYMLGYIDIAES